VAGREVKGELPADPDRLFAASLVDPVADLATEAAAYRPPFSHLAMLVQVPGIDLPARLAAEKGEPLSLRELEILDERTVAARGWLQSYAPDRVRIAVQRDALPPAAAGLDADQRRVLGRLAESLAARPTAGWAGESVQAAIFDAARDEELPAGRAFAALYASFLGQSSGPRAGWLLASLEPEFVVQRLREAAAADTLPA
jgi:lysyl-tRNA synthetase class 1